ncbi:MAG: hypothetical protein GF388_10065 [Candidatus Aegiribacteria sp.]|nr:hypothetical protein [Candidatus Aegiribacteria sp.]MBD3295377.1 hypothetical protein [Candidatus Fermentibacteria bacterium]
MLIRLRIDIYLKLMGVFKTRSMSGKACRSGHVSMEGRKLKPSHTVKTGDIIDIVKPDGSSSSVEVLGIPETAQVSRQQRREYHRIVGMEG